MPCSQWEYLGFNKRAENVGKREFSIPGKVLYNTMATFDWILLEHPEGNYIRIRIKME